MNLIVLLSGSVLGYCYLFVLLLALVTASDTGLVGGILFIYYTFFCHFFLSISCCALLDAETLESRVRVRLGTSLETRLSDFAESLA